MKSENEGDSRANTQNKRKSWKKRISDVDVAVSFPIAVAQLNNGYFIVEIWKIINIKVKLHPFS